MSEEFYTSPELIISPSELDEPTQPKSKTNPWMISTFILLSIVLVGGFYVFSLQNSTSRWLTEKQPTADGTTPETSAEIDATHRQLTLKESLAQFCLDSKISPEKLPVKISQKLLDSYQQESRVWCGVSPMNYAHFHKTVQTENSSWYSRSVYIFTEDSIYEGFGDHLIPLAELADIMVDNQPYYLLLGQVDGGPGISEESIHISLIAQKTDPESQSIIRVMVNDVLKNQLALDLVSQYGTVEQTDYPAGTKVIMPGAANKKVFMQKFAELAPQIPEISEMAKTAQGDLDEIRY